MDNDDLLENLNLWSLLKGTVLGSWSGILQFTVFARWYCAAALRSDGSAEDLDIVL